MVEIIALRRTAHDQVQLLLPWFVARTLSREENDSVEAHLAECAECRSELRCEQQLCSAIGTMSPSVERGWAAISDRLDARTPIYSQPMRSLWRRRVGLGSLVTAQLATAAALGALVYLKPAQSMLDKSYHVLGTKSASPAGNALIMFQPTVREEQMRATLVQVNADIVGGPNASGAYVISVPKDRRAQVLDQLRLSSSVMLAEPIDVTS